MTRPGHFFWWRGHHADRSGDGRWTEVGEEAFQEDERRITGRHRLPGPVPDWAEDLFRVARAAFIVDKYVRRDGGRDRWARHVRLSVPVTEYGRWRSGTVRDDLAGLFQLLTGDAWEIEFRPLTGHGVEEALDFPEEPRASEVALFSGGLDSTSWAAARSRVEDSRPLLLVMFREIGLLRQQRQVYSAVERLSGARPVMLLPMSQTPRGDGSPLRLETSSRTRGLLYASGAVRAATAHGVATVHVPENGQLALNPPLTPARSAACSTRSVHPRTLALLNSVLGVVGEGAGAVTVVNPWGWLTKGEVCAAGKAAGLTPSELESTLSCGKPPARRKGGPSLANCGVCFPCLVRRSGLLHANGADRTPYEAAPWEDHLSLRRGEDWRALRRWLLGSYGLTDVITDTPLPPDVAPTAALELIERGRGELARLVELAAARRFSGETVGP
ncbi:7-cyano-7-deazaguanine synthase [Streptomyces sp. WA1-19]|uniref:7-cyano-7-deazaguanine synthase n=1 Tax=unclassified Streptomyces TaxID=2593676 RepID=UPI001D047DCC|nr:MULTISPECIES: 7-cyano-7-deazaguanine synthase [unclassified Streptomyces]UDF07778.1 7-cyano-7-deazaguanine synthase [Streptomyces sp. WA1-19]UYX93185.1 7-cyano-7-deazaguanine synthase [Streptomyces sp. BI87]